MENHWLILAGKLMEAKGFELYELIRNPIPYGTFNPEYNSEKAIYI